MAKTQNQANQTTRMSSAFKDASIKRSAIKARLKHLVTHHREVNHAQALRAG